MGQGEKRIVVRSAPILVIAVYFCTYFLPFLSNFKTFFLSFFHMLTTHEYQDTRHHCIGTRNKPRLHCTQDGLPQDGLTASFYRLVMNHRTIKGHVELLDSPLSHQFIDPTMLLDHVLDLTGFYQFHETMKPGGSYQMKIGLDVTIQSRTHYLRYLQLSLGCDS